MFAQATGRPGTLFYLADRARTLRTACRATPWIPATRRCATSGPASAAPRRRAELVALDLADLRPVPEGLVLTLRR